MNKNTKKKKITSIIIFILLLAVIVGLVYYFFLMPEEVVEVSYQTSQPEIGDIEVVLENSGVIKYTDESEIKSDVTGTINNIYIDEDSYIKNGELVLDIDRRIENLNLEQTQIDLYLAKLNLADLLNTNVGNIDNVSVNDLTTVVAPTDGVLWHSVQIGENVNNGVPIMNITKIDELNFKTSVLATDLQYIEIGDEAYIDVDDYPTNLTGNITKMNYTSYSDGNDMINDIWITVQNPGIKAGMTGYARVFTTYAKDVKGVFENVTDKIVFSTINGAIEEIYVESGEYVTAGTPLFKIDSTSLENQIEQQKQTIYNKELNIQELLLNMEDTTVVSDVSGVVTDLYVKEGESINNGTKIASVVSDSLVASIDIDELDIGKVELGQEAKLIIPGYSEDEEIVGTVSYIADKGNVLDGITTYEVHISFDSNEKIKEGMTVEVTIIVDSATDVVMVPSSSIKTMNNRSMVQVLENGEVTMKPVEIGISDDFYTEIVSGIDESVEVITSMESTVVPVMGDMSEEEMMEMRDQMKKSGQPPSDGGGMGGMGGLTGGGK